MKKILLVVLIILLSGCTGVSLYEKIIIVDDKNNATTECIFKLQNLLNEKQIEYIKLTCIKDNGYLTDSLYEIGLQGIRDKYDSLEIIISNEWITDERVIRYNEYKSNELLY